jgi:glutamate-1-semialdehyde 2,1-aminomutase
VDRVRLGELLAGELARFADEHPRSRELHERSERFLFGGVPMPWMRLWAGAFPVYGASASGARITDVDGHAYVDLCLGDTGAMTGHSPAPVREAVARQLATGGITTMLPSEDAAWVGEELGRRFGPEQWMFTLTATDANRAALRLAREVTGRGLVLVFSYCYHGSVDEAFAVGERGVTRSRAGNVGAAVDPAMTTRAIEWNDVDALAATLEPRDVACVLAEPAMTNMGIVLPDPGYHDELRRLTRETGTLLIIDETHTFSAGPGGCTAAWGLAPDMVTLGKAMGSGIPCGALGLRADVGDRALASAEADYEDTGGIGGTLAGNVLSLAAVRATLGEVLTEEAFERTIPLAGRFADGVREVIDSHGLPWNVTQLGCRAEYRFEAERARNGSAAHAASDPELERFMHLYALNRGVLLTPFHNMALISPETTPEDVDRHSEVFAAAVGELL